MGTVVLCFHPFVTSAKSSCEGHCRFIAGLIVQQEAVVVVDFDVSQPRMKHPPGTHRDLTRHKSCVVALRLCNCQLSGVNRTKNIHSRLFRNRHSFFPVTPSSLSRQCRKKNRRVATRTTNLSAFPPLGGEVMHQSSNSNPNHVGGGGKDMYTRSHIPLGWVAVCVPSRFARMMKRLEPERKGVYLHGMMFFAVLGPVLKTRLE